MSQADTMVDQQAQPSADRGVMSNRDSSPDKYDACAPYPRETRQEARSFATSTGDSRPECSKVPRWSPDMF
jgi:hypothetical protein